jgi:hypothetical protein
MTSNARYDHPLTLDQIATAAARLITEARAAALAAPYNLTCHDFDKPTIILYLSAYEVRDIRTALQAWGDCYGSSVTIRPGVTPGHLHGEVTFNRDGIRCEVSGIIASPAPGDDAA